MKIINEKGKLFGIINPVDLMVLVVFVAILFGVSWKLFGPTIRESVATTVEMTTVVRIRGANEFLLAELSRNAQEGKKLVSGNEYLAATVESVIYEDYVIQATTDDGRIVNAVDPTKKDVVMTIKSTCPKDTPTPKIGNQEVRAGRTMIVKTNDFETNASIISVEMK